jgi:hypothetical protein
MPTVAPTAVPNPTALPTAVPSPTAAPSPTPVEPTAMPPGWTQIILTGDQPPARYDHSALFDPVRGQLLVFGGRGDGPLGDTWAFDMLARTWREVSGPGPEPRFGHGAVYDAATRRMIVVMGQGSKGFFNDAWAFDLDQETWVQLKSNDTGNGPRPRYGQSAALDGGARVLISHGFSDQGRFDDTWAFDLASADWVELTPAQGARPLKRCLHELNYDVARNQLILFGGCSSGFGPCPQGDMWAFDLSSQTWAELEPAGGRPSARSTPSLVYDGDGGRSWLFGGLTADGPSAEIWSYDIDRGGWAQLESSGGPSARSSQSASRNAQTGGILIFGGLTADGPSAELWMWNA